MPVGTVVTSRASGWSGPGRDRDRAGRSALEARTRKVGLQLLRRTARYQPWRLSPKWIEDALFTRLVGDETLRAPLLRFVDVYPVLKDRSEIARHLAEYLREAVERNQRWRLLRLVEGSIGRLASRKTGASWVAWGSGLAIRHLANRFMVAQDDRSLLASLQRLERQGYLFTLDVLGEEVHSDPEAQAFLQRYIDLAGGLGRKLPPRAVPSPFGSGPRVNLSIKMSSLVARFDPGDPEGTGLALKERLRTLFRAAREAGSFICVDMETRSTRNLILKVFMEVLSEEEFRDWPHVGVVSQAYLRDAESSLDSLLDWVRWRRTEITIRLVKGAYWDSEQIWARQKGWPIPVLTSKSATDAQFERCLERLVQNHAIVRTAVGSHNARSIARALALAEHLGIPPGRLEVQMLHGMAEPLRRAARDEAVPVRIYVPTGELVPGMAYLVRRLLENTSQNSFVRQLTVERAAVEALLENPARPILPSAREGAGS